MKTLEVLRKLNAETDAEVFITGGFVRDLLRKKRNDDLDIVIRKIDLEAAAKFLKGFGKVKLVNISSNVHDTFSVPVLLFKAHGDHVEAQLTLPRTRKRKAQTASPNITLQQDAKHRDFTINAMYLPINFKSAADVIDFEGGVVHMANRVVVSVREMSDRIVESPIRIMRALTLSSKMNFDIGVKTLAAIKQHGKSLALVKPENLRDELNILLLSKRPSKYLKLMKKLDLLPIVLPELYKCIRVKQDPRYHKYDVFTHCIYTCDNTEPDLVLRLAGLLHDIGKPDTMRIIEDGAGKRITFHRHEMVSVNLTKDMLHRLRYDNDTTEKVVELVRLHMYHYTGDVYRCTIDACGWVRPSSSTVVPSLCPQCAAPVDIQKGWTDGAVRKFITKAGITAESIDRLGELPLFKLRSAERLGNGLKKVPVTEKQKDFETRIRNVFSGSTGFAIKDLKVNGHMLIKLFNMRPGTEIGEVLNHLLELVLEEPALNEEGELIQRAAIFLHNRR